MNDTDEYQEAPSSSEELSQNPVSDTEQIQESDDPSLSLDPLKRSSKFSWRSFGGDGFLFSLIFHAVLGIIAIFLVVNHYVAPAVEEPDGFVSGGGGGNNGSDAKIQEHRMKPKNARDMVKSKSRITSKSATATLALPEMPTMSMSSSFDTGMKSGGDSSGFGGGSGGGIGSGKGIGVGGGTNFVSAFGSRFKRSNDMEGSLFDLKRTPSGSTICTTANDNGNKEKRMKELHDAMRMLDKKWDVSGLKKSYFKAPTTLYNSKVFIVGDNGNALPANKATEAFAGDDGKAPFGAPGWLCYYEGWFSVPEDGEYRFVGMGDDAMIVGVDKKTALYAFWPGEGHGPAVTYRKGWEPANFCGKGGNDGKTLQSPGQRSSIYKGDWRTYKVGKKYRIQVAFGEAAGGLGGACLGIQRKGRDDDNNFPMFTLDMMDPIPAWNISQTGRYNISRLFIAR